MKKILVIDDETDMEFIFSTMLEDEITSGSVKMDYFSNPLACYESVSSNIGDEYDVIFSDINMPQINGIQLVSKLRERGYKGKIVFISAYSKADYIDDMKNLNVENFISKPIDFNALKTMMGIA